MMYDNKLIKSVRQGLGNAAQFVGSIVPRNSKLIMLLFLTTTGIVKVQAQSSQCLTDAINGSFQNDQGYIGVDSVYAKMNDNGFINLGGGGSNFSLYKNGTLQSTGSCSFLINDDIEIKPIQHGMETIEVLSFTGGCPDLLEDNTAMATVLPVTRAGVPSVEPIGDRRYRVKFATSKEWGNSHFTIEGIAEGDTNYQDLAITPSLAVEGNADARHDYSVEFDAPEGVYNKRLYIRIRQTDKDGTSSVNTGDDPSQLLSVWLGGPDDLRVFPNPVSQADGLHVQLPEGFITDEDTPQYSIRNIHGQTVAQGGYDGSGTIDLLSATRGNRLPGGVYTLTIMNRGVPMTVRVVIQG